MLSTGARKRMIRALDRSAPIDALGQGDFFSPHPVNAGDRLQQGRTGSQNVAPMSPYPRPSRWTGICCDPVIPFVWPTGVSRGNPAGHAGNAGMTPSNAELKR